MAIGLILLPFLIWIFVWSSILLSYAKKKHPDTYDNIKVARKTHFQNFSFFAELCNNSQPKDGKYTFYLSMVRLGVIVFLAVFVLFVII